MDAFIHSRRRRRRRRRGAAGWICLYAARRRLWRCISGHQGHGKGAPDTDSSQSRPLRRKGERRRSPLHELGGGEKCILLFIHLNKDWFSFLDF